MNPPIETEDSRFQLKKMSLEEAARTIQAQHAAFIHARVDAIDQTEKVCNQAADIASLVETVHAALGGRRFMAWWDEQKMPPGWAARYLKLARTADRRTLADKDQLRLIGVLPEPETTTTGQSRRRPNPFAWIKWTAKIRKSFPEQSLEVMDEAERKAALKHLKPIRELIDRLEGAPPHKESL